MPKQPHEPSTPTPKWARWLVGFFFVIHALIMVQGIQEDFMTGHHGWAASMRGTIGRNYDEQGFIKTGLLPYKNFGHIDDIKKARPHWNHPPGINLMTGVSFRIFGQHNASIKIIPILFGLISFWMVFFLAKRRHGPLAGCLSAGAFMLLPIQMEYGKFCNYDPVVMSLALMSLLMLERLRDHGHEWTAKKRHGFLALLCLTLMGAGFTDWTGFILAGFIGMDALIRKPRKKWVFLAIGVSTSIFAIWVIWWLSHAAHDNALLQLANMRSGGKFTYTKLFTKLAQRIHDYYLVFPLMLAISWIIKHAIKTKSVDPVVFVFAGMNLVYVLAFKQAAWIHNFYICYLLPAVAVAMGVGIAHFTQCIKAARTRVAVCIVLCAVFVIMVVRQAPDTHKRSYGIKPKRMLGFPLDGRMDQNILGKWLNKNTKQGDRYLIDHRIRPSMGLRYYAGRQFLRKNALPLNPQTPDVLYVTQVRLLKKEAQHKASKRYPTTLLAGYLIYDLRRPKTKEIKALNIEAQKMTWGHWYWVSTIYPPYLIKENQAETLRYKKSINIQ